MAKRDKPTESQTEVVKTTNTSDVSSESEGQPTVVIEQPAPGTTNPEEVIIVKEPDGSTQEIVVPVTPEPTPEPTPAVVPVPAPEPSPIVVPVYAPGTRPEVDQAELDALFNNWVANHPYADSKEREEQRTRFLLGGN